MKTTDLKTTLAGVFAAAVLLYHQVLPLVHLDWKHVSITSILLAALAALGGYHAKDS